jgi:pimeloyl-ACP methyl ester carboxylesterase
MEPGSTLQTDDAPAESRAPCPTPLVWSEVLAAWRCERRPIEVRLERGVVRGASFGTGPPLYCLNAASGDFELFALMAWLLREDARCVCFDYPSLPAASAGEERLRRLSDALSAVADAQGDDTFHLLAAGFGSMVALNVMLDRPARIARSVLVCGYAHRRLSLIERGLVTWGSFWPGRLKHVPGCRSVQMQNHRPWFPPFDVSRWEFLADNLGASRTRDVARRLAVLADVDLRPRLRDIRQPVLLVRTEGEGRIETACQDELQTGLPLAHSEWLHTSGQVPHLTHPHRLVKLVKVFLSEDPDKPPALGKGVQSPRSVDSAIRCLHHQPRP